MNERKIPHELSVNPVRYFLSKVWRRIIMKYSKRHIFYLAITVLIAFFLATYQLPYYIYKPGSADPLDPVVEVVDGFQSEGDMHLVTVSGGRATPVQYLWAKFLSYHEIQPLEEVIPKGISNEEYRHAQLQMMENSQESSTVVAYEAANKEIAIAYNGVYVVSVREGMPAEGNLEMGDRITGIDGHPIKEADDLINYIDDKEAGDHINMEVNRDEQTIEVSLELGAYEELDGKVGMGIELVTNRHVKVDPEVHFSSGNIGGPSAGLMFALEIYDQLTEEDLTKGYQIIGTGALDYQGNVLPIGGVDKKVVAADRAGGDFFFVPYEEGAIDSNYEVAKKTAEEIDTPMEIVPVDTFQEALKYLQDLD